MNLTKIVAVFILVQGLLSSTAWAHVKPLEVAPAANSTVSAPKEVRLTFGEHIESVFDDISIVDADGHKLDTAKASIDEATGKILSISLPKLPSGTYTVNWAAIGNDGHHSTGSYVFTVK